MSGVLLDALGMPIYRPEEPNEIRKLMLVAGLLSRPANMYVTATRWARIAAEIRANHQADLRQPWNLPHRDNFKRMKIGRLTVINAGTEDEEVCNLANWHEVPPDFRARVESMKTGRGGTKFYPDAVPD
jgi:hypothetical protein